MIDQLSKKELLLKRFKSIRKQSLKITDPLKIEDFVCQPIVDVSPPKWHLGHSSWFFENFILSKYKKDYQPFDPNFNFIFNSYYESQGSRILRNKRGGLNRPSTEQILAYRKQVDEQLAELLDQPNEFDEQFYQFMELGLQHEQQHQELLLTDIKYIFADNPLLPVYKDYSIPENKQASHDWLDIEEGVYQIGYSGDDFSFDNERERHKVYLHAYQLSNRLVTNAEFLEFINDGGYERFEFWLSEGWDWVKEHQAKFPLYWLKEEGDWFTFELNGLQTLRADDPICHINYYEAEAFARWKGKRLPTEAEWEVAALHFGKLHDAESFSEWGIPQPQTKITQPNFYGGVWEWTSSDYAPYPHYKQAKGALGEYNGKFMVNQRVLKGGSCATPKSHFRPSYRNFFHPNLQWQFSGLRLAESI
jgi:ergothioneine biosynthesis protein EgtB